MEAMSLSFFPVRQARHDRQVVIVRYVKRRVVTSARCVRGAERHRRAHLPEVRCAVDRSVDGVDVPSASESWMYRPEAARRVGPRAPPVPSRDPSKDDRLSGRLCFCSSPRCRTSLWASLGSLACRRPHRGRVRREASGWRLATAVPVELRLWCPSDFLRSASKRRVRAASPAVFKDLSRTYSALCPRDCESILRFFVAGVERIEPRRPAYPFGLRGMPPEFGIYRVERIE